jgi:ferredoxin-like protein FixX
MRKDGIFIGIKVDEHAAADTSIAQRLTDACPVDIFAQQADGSLQIVDSSLDECVLCRLCMDAAPGKVNVIKLYDAGALLA